MNTPKSGELYKLFDMDKGHVRHHIIVDWVKDGIVGHHVDEGNSCRPGSMQCTIEQWYRYIKEGKLY